MATHQIHVTIPEDHRLLVEVPQTIRSGPATLILVTSSDSEAEADTQAESARREASSSGAAVTATKSCSQL